MAVFIITFSETEIDLDLVNE